MSNTIWEIELQIKNGWPLKHFEWPFKGKITDCVNYLKGNIGQLNNSGGVLVSDNAIGNVFFKIERGLLMTSSSPYAGLKHNAVNKPL